MSSAPSDPHRTRVWVAALVSVAGLLAALTLPFAPVETQRTTVTWPVAGQPATSTTALFAPYRPTALTAEIPCAVLRADASTMVLATATGTDGLLVEAGAAGAVVTVNGTPHDVDVPAETAPDCRVSVRAGPQGASIVDATGQIATFRDEAVPEVFGFRTDLSGTASAGMSVTAEVETPFATSPTPAKRVAIAVALCSAVLALVLLRRGPPRRLGVLTRRALWRPRLWWVDVVVIAVLGVWAVIGPLAVDDGWATTIARNFADTGDAGNYYRWWNAPEAPFALSQEVLSRLTDVSLAPLWLRLPSTVLAVATWFALSRGILGAAVPRLARTASTRALAALFFMAAWLPFNLGTRPESYVALGLTLILALLWRARTPLAVGLAVLTAALTIPVSPTAVIVVAPFVVFAPRIRQILGRDGRRETIVQCALLCCVGAVAITVMFADQTWAAMVTATEWHTYFGPSLPWYVEYDRYLYLLSGDQQGSAAKRLPVLMAFALLGLVTVSVWRRGGSSVDRSVLRIGAVLVVALAAMAFVPSKWSYHLGAVAGLLAALVTVGVLAVTRRSASAPRWVTVLGVIVVVGVTAWVFSGPNAWWLSTVYDVPWPNGSMAVAVSAVAVVSLLAAWGLTRSSLRPWPAAVVVAAAVVGVAMLVASFVIAPAHRPAGSLAVANVNRVNGSGVCGLADDIEVLPDGPAFPQASAADAQVTGFRFLAGYFPDAPPPDAPGTGSAAALWGSYGATAASSVRTPWFAVPTMPANGGVAVSVSGRTTGANSLTFEFGRDDGARVVPLGSVAPADRVAIDEKPSHPLWRSIGVDVAQIPAGADRVRIVATDDGDDWLAFTGPRARMAVGMTEFLAGNGPVLISWPQAFVFPCVRDIARVSGGLAQTPRTVIESPRPFFGEDRDRAVGGTFAGLALFGGLHEVPTRLSGHPEIDWGTLLTASTDVVRDAYTRTTTPEVRWGFDSAGRVGPES